MMARQEVFAVPGAARSLLEATGAGTKARLVPEARLALDTAQRDFATHCLAVTAQQSGTGSYFRFWLPLWSQPSCLSCGPAGLWLDSQHLDVSGICPQTATGSRRLPRAMMISSVTTMRTHEQSQSC